MGEITTRCLTISELFSKEVINTATGERLGFVTDGEIDAERGIIRFLCVPVPCKSPFAKTREIKKFCYDDIVRIGSDTILIKSACTCTVKPKKLL